MNKLFIRFLLVYIFASLQIANANNSDIHVSVIDQKITTENYNEIYGHDLLISNKPSLGEVLSSKAGIQAMTHGNIASSPVIRGNNKVNIISDGVKNSGISSIAPDHVIPIDTMMVDKIEVVRGSDALLFGADSVVGTVNISNHLIKTSLPANKFNSSQILKYSSVSNGKTAGISSDIVAGNFVTHVGGITNQSMDYRSGQGRVMNSATKNSTYSGSLSYIGKNGSLGASIEQYDNNYDLPNNGKKGDYIDVSQNRANFQAEFLNPTSKGLVKSVKYNAVLNQYKHAEFAQNVNEKFFGKDTYSNRIEFIQHGKGILDGKFGVQFTDDRFTQNGEDLNMLTKSNSYSLFASENLQYNDNFSNKIGLRFESLSYKNSNSVNYRNRNFENSSFSLDNKYAFNENYSVFLNISALERSPESNELYSNGHHDALGVFELGNQNLKNEKSYNAEFGTKISGKKGSFNVSLYNREYQKYIFANYTGGTKDNLPVIQYTQTDAKFYGMDMAGNYDFYQTDLGFIGVDSMLDRVNAKADNFGNLPRISPTRAGLGLYVNGKNWNTRIGGRHVFEQNKNALNETKTKGFSMLDAMIFRHIETPKSSFDLILKGENLTNKKAMNHLSFIKNQALLPGRNVSFTIKSYF